MPYATKTDLLNRFKLQQAIGPTGFSTTEIISDATIDVHLSDASNLIDSFLSSQYNLPFQTTPPELTRMTCVLAFCSLMIYRGINPDLDSNKTIFQERDLILEQLKRVQNGTQLNGLTSGRFKMPIPTSNATRGF